MTLVFTKRMPKKILLKSIWLKILTDSAKVSEDIPNTINESCKDITYENPPQIIFQKPIFCTCLFLSTNLDDYKKSLERITEVIASDSPETSSSPIPSSDCPPSLFLSSSIDIDAKEMIRALGCLLNYVSTLQSHELLEGDSFQIRINAFHILQLDNYMFIDRVGIVSFALVAALPSQSGYLLDGVAPFAD